ncbi:MAG: DUF4258 domain-containing protein [Caldilineaceae bacterium]|nr:DUF4258 domain-containing protein [Caldilineaceae bacterium]
MRRRGISSDDLEEGILHGEILERERDAGPLPKCIFWGFTMRLSLFSQFSQCILRRSTD